MLNVPSPGKCNFIWLTILFVPKHYLSVMQPTKTQPQKQANVKPVLKFYWSKAKEGVCAVKPLKENPTFSMFIYKFFYSTQINYQILNSQSVLHLSLPFGSLISWHSLLSHNKLDKCCLHCLSYVVWMETNRTNPNSKPRSNRTWALSKMMLEATRALSMSKQFIA